MCRVMNLTNVRSVPKVLLQSNPAAETYPNRFTTNHLPFTVTFMNYRLLIQYDGTDFHGWQVQENDRSIQGELERVIGMLADTEVAVVGSGRTDAGVHAEGQVENVHLDGGKFT